MGWLVRSTYRILPIGQTIADPDAELRAWLRSYATKHPCHGSRRAWATLRYCVIDHRGRHEPLAWRANLRDLVDVDVDVDVVTKVEREEPIAFCDFRAYSSTASR